jgi:phosphate transport system permease protein
LASARVGKQAVRFLADVLAGVPSIVIGYFGYVTLVTTLGWEFSAAAGSVALAVISVPYICRTTEMVLRGVARGAYALGATDRQVVLGITVPAALPGIVTGILLALAISVGETAPLLLWPDGPAFSGTAT